MDNSENVRVGSPEWYMMKKFTKTLLVIDTPKDAVVDTLVKEYKLSYKMAFGLYASAAYALSKGTV